MDAQAGLLAPHGRDRPWAWLLQLILDAVHSQKRGETNAITDKDHQRTDYHVAAA